MNKKLASVIKDANKKLKNDNIFKNFEITIDGTFVGDMNFINLSSDHRHFPIATVATEIEAVAAIGGYMAGLEQGANNSYPKLCDNY
jgi:hypothetical protein